MYKSEKLLGKARTSGNLYGDNWRSNENIDFKNINIKVWK